MANLVQRQHASSVLLHEKMVPDSDKEIEQKSDQGETQGYKVVNLTERPGSSKNGGRLKHHVNGKETKHAGSIGKG